MILIIVFLFFYIFPNSQAGLFTGRTLNSGYSTAQLNLRPITDDVKFMCAQPGNLSFVRVLMNDTDLITKLDTGKPIAFIIHGYMGSYLDPPYAPMMIDYVNFIDSNFCVVDWRFLANFDYSTSVGQMNRVADHLALFIKFLVNTSNFFTMNEVRVFGFSLGAHLAGYTGKALKGQLPLIVGLDPAGPLFAGASTSARLDPTDAKFVEVIHTDRINLGTSFAFGHADYYPNNANNPQPGCPSNQDTFENTVCSHARSLQLFRASFNPLNKLKGYVCGSYADFMLGKCLLKPTDLVGVNSNFNVRGQLFFNTSAIFPFV